LLIFLTSDFPSSPAKECLFADDFYRLFKQIHPNMKFSRGAFVICDDFVTWFLARLAEVKMSAASQAPKGGSGQPLLIAGWTRPLELVCNGDLCKNVVAKATTALEKAHKARGGGVATAASTGEQRSSKLLKPSAGSLRSDALIEHVRLQMLTISGIHLTDDEGVVLAAATEHAICVILELGTQS
jgi:hypothetical protein